jgi:hypothetical protein
VTEVDSAGNDRGRAHDLVFHCNLRLDHLYVLRGSQAPMIVTPQSAMPRCTCVVDLISRVFRPYLFLVTVTGVPPHQGVRRYKVAADSDDSAAMKGLELFVKEFMPPVVRDEMATLAPRAKLQ